MTPAAYILTGTSEEVLYDELGDPDELVNLIHERPEMAGQMREYLAGWMNQTGDRHTLPGVTDPSGISVSTRVRENGITEIIIRSAN